MFDILNSLTLFSWILIAVAGLWIVWYFDIAGLRAKINGWKTSLFTVFAGVITTLQTTGVTEIVPAKWIGLTSIGVLVIFQLLRMETGNRLKTNKSHRGSRLGLGE